jgi:ABC-type sulfate/molybdate transport systems ATPase subunit
VRSIELRGINKRFDDFKALRDVSVMVSTGELVALLGPSGSGKTTLLRIIAGLEMPDDGAVLFDDVVMREGGVEQIGTPEEVYEPPATPFVYQFLGNVNPFHGRVEGDKIHFGEFTMEVSHGCPGEALPAVAYARRHRLDIDHQLVGQPQFCATVVYIHAAGSVVKVELTTLTGASVHVEMSQERYQSLRL